jgi:hypothetical protein
MNSAPNPVALLEDVNRVLNLRGAPYATGLVRLRATLPAAIAALRTRDGGSRNG